MTEIIIFIVGGFLGYHLGQMILAWRLKDILVKEARKEGIYVDDEYNLIEDTEKKPTVSQLFIERANNVMYLYDKEAGSFVCQGSTLEELATLAKKYKNIKYAAVMDEHTDNVVAFVDGRVELNILKKIHES